MTKLVCPECRRENEPERIYCHDCGARLDRSAVKTADRNDEAPEEAHRRVRSMFDPNRDRVRRTVMKFAKLVLAAFATAAVIEILLPPDVPPQRELTGLAPQIALELERATPGSVPVRVTTEEANAYLATTLKNKRRSLSSWPQFERAIVQFGDNTCRLVVARSVFGYSVYTSASSRLAIANGALRAEITSGEIGRLPVHPRLMQFAGFLFKDVASALDQDRRTVGKMRSVQIQPGAITITP